MTTLILLRHAKAVASDPAGDHNRALSERGRGAAAAVGALLRGLDPPIDLALVSDARRTQQTADLALSPGAGSLQVRIEPHLYGASPDIILATLRKVGREHASVLVIGHNPGIGEVARQLCGAGGAEEIGVLRARFPTAAVAVIDFGQMPWSDLRVKAGTLRRFVVPDAGD